MDELAPEIKPTARYGKRSLILLAGALLFGISHTQAPLYFSNQHQYFLHGLAAGGAGYLDRDWLANTLDPTPIFSAFAAFTYRHLDVFVFYLVFLFVQAIYFLSLMSIGSLLIPEGPRRPVSLFVLGVLLIVIHSGIVRLASVQLTGVDYPWFFQAGVAGQYVLGPGLQPSAFGVLLISSVAAFAHGRLVLAVACSSIACILHATYLLPAAMFTIAYMLALYRSGHIRSALLVGAGSLLSVLPIVFFAARTFAPTNPQLFAEAQRIVADLRIPHHTRADRWFDVIAGLQIGSIILALMLIRQTKLFIVLGIPALLSFLLSLLQVATDSHALALLFPWRTSVILMPIATCIIFARLVSPLGSEDGASRLTKKAATWSAAAALAITVVGGLVIQFDGLAYHANESELQTLKFVRSNKKPGDVYLIPLRIPGKGPRGSMSASFTPPPRGKEKHLIVVDMQRFRLFTEAPLYVDFKSIPYKDVDVLEWRRRLDRNQEWYANMQSPATREEMRREGVTHVIIQADRPIEAPGFAQVYEDPSYRIYRLVPTLDSTH